MKGNKTTAIEPVRTIHKLLKKNGIEKISYGIIVSIKGRRDHRAQVKIKQDTGCILCTVTSKRYKQEFRIYESVSTEFLVELCQKNLGEQFRITT